MGHETVGRRGPMVQEVAETVPPKKDRTASPQPPVEKKTVGRLRSDLEKILGTKEASRAQLLLQTRKDGKSNYLLGFEPPTAEEVREVRREIAELQSQVRKEDAERFDEILGEQIENFDCFGSMGKKCLHLTIPDDASSGSQSGLAFKVDDFEEARKMFEGDGFTIHASRIWIGSKENGGIAERFDEILKTLGTGGEGKAGEGK